MQVTQQTVDRYARDAPELLDSVDSLDGGYIMKRDPATDYCVKFDKGWCGIQRDYGSEFLGDACHFFPRITRALGEKVFVAATLSCPEIARLMLYGDTPFVPGPHEEIRAPYSLTQYLPAGISAEDALALHQLFITEAANPAFTAEINLMRCISATQSMQTQAVEQWPGAAAFYFRMAESRIPAADAVPEDLFNLVLTLHGLMTASHADTRPRLLQIRNEMAEILGMTFGEETGQVTTAPDAYVQVLRMQHYWKANVHTAMQPVLTRYLQAQLSAALFPFAGLGASLYERIVIIGVRFAMVKLALMAHAMQVQAVPDAANTVRMIQTLSRFLDHLADPSFSLSIYQETGWMREPRLRALLAE
jgi:lysine-N-methylase